MCVSLSSFRNREHTQEKHHLGVQVPGSEHLLLCLWTSTWLLPMCSCTHLDEYLLAQGGQQLAGPQVTLDLYRFFDWKVGC